MSRAEAVVVDAAASWEEAALELVPELELEEAVASCSEPEARTLAMLWKTTPPPPAGSDGDAAMAGHAVPSARASRTAVSAASAQRQDKTPPREVMRKLFPLPSIIPSRLPQVCNDYEQTLIH